MTTPGLKEDEEALYKNQDLIDDFMGRQHWRMNPSHAWYSYHNDWKYLMPVVEKISKLYLVRFSHFKPYALTENEKEPYDIEEYCSVIALPISTPIEEVYKEIIEFIHWYNSQPPTP